MTFLFDKLMAIPCQIDGTDGKLVGEELFGVRVDDLARFKRETVGCRTVPDR